MALWMGTHTQKFDMTGQLLLRFASMFIGIGLGLLIARFIPAIPVIFPVLLGLALIWFAQHGAATPAESPVELRTK